MKEHEIKLFNKKKAMFSRGTFTRCIECDYQALTWHSNLEELNMIDNYALERLSEPKESKR